MATFQFSSHRVELEFPGGIKCVLPLTEETQEKVKQAAKELLAKSKALKGAEGTAEDMDALCDYTLDAVDSILGEGMADQIMAAKEDYTFLDCADLFKFVTEEFNKAFIATVNSYKGSKPQAKPNAAPPVNRAQRRRRRRGK